MAFKNSFVLAFLFTLCILLSIANEASAGRSVPKEVADTKEPEFLFDHHDGSVLIPGIGRVLLPPLLHGKYHGHDLLHYNPITGTYGDTGGVTFFGDVGGRPSRGYIPGGDDTFIPNPGFEVPIPGRAGRGPPVTGSPMISGP